MTFNRKAYNKEYRSKKKNKVRHNAWMKACYLKNKEEKREYNKEYRSKTKNKEHKKAWSSEYYLKNKERFKEYKLKHKEHVKKYMKEYHIGYSLKNKERIQKYRNRYEMERKKTDPNFKLRITLRQRIQKALKGLNKSNRTRELLGCTIDELWTHLESKFTDGMTRENHGKWHVDHIKACSKFDLTDPKQQQICFHWSNLQPLWALDNIRKGNT